MTFFVISTGLIPYVAVAEVLLNAVQLPIYTNVIANGKNIETDAMEMETYINQSGIASICYGQDDSVNPYLQNCYGYFMQPFIEIEMEQIEEYTTRDSCAFIVASALDVEKAFEGNKLTKVLLDTEEFNLYVRNDLK